MQTYCERSVLELEEIVENIAKVLDQMMKRQQANILRRKFGMAGKLIVAVIGSYFANHK